jgi:hypothetical protein
MTPLEAFSIVASPSEQLNRLLWVMNHGLTTEDLEEADRIAEQREALALKAEGGVGGGD